MRDMSHAHARARAHTRTQAVLEADLEADENVSDLFLGQAIAQTLQPVSHCCLTAQLACTTNPQACASA